MAMDPQMLAQRLNRWLFYLLFASAFGLLAWLSQHHSQVWDWTAGGRNSLSETSVEVIGRLQEPLSITAFAQDNPLLRKPLESLIERYRAHSPQISFRFIDPEREPALTRQLGIQVPGELLLSYQGRDENLQQVNEEQITNAIQRLLMGRERWIAFLGGHGERNPKGEANHDLGTFGQALQQKGYQVQTLQLSDTAQIPDNTSLLIIAGPRIPLLPGEVSLIESYLFQGGNLLWLLDPDETQHLDLLSKALGLKVLPGTVVDINAYAMGIKDPAMAIVNQYPDHPAVSGIGQISLFPHAAALTAEPPEGWSLSPVLQSHERTWNETGKREGEIRPDAEGEQPGPLNLGLAFTREQNGQRQKVLVLGDGDFLANAYLGNGANLNLGLNLIRWLSGDEALLDIPAKTAPDTQLNLSQAQGIVIALVFLILLPIGLLITGARVWWRRRHR